MLLDRTHRKWALISTIVLLVATLTYVVYARTAPKGPTGGSWMGLMYGIVGAIMMLFAGLLAGRKQIPHWRLGSAQFWLRGHIWLGTLSLPMILFHSGFGLGGRLEQLLWMFFGIVIASGFFGLAMQHLLPKLITTQISRETFVVQLPYIRKRNRLICDKLVSKESTKIPLVEDVLKPQLVALAQHAVDVKSLSGSQAKDLKGQWADRLQAENRLLFVEFAKHAKAEKWITREDDFTAHLFEIYDIPGLSLTDPVTAASKPEADAAAVPASTTTAAVEAATSAEKPVAADASATPAKKLSPLEMMKAKAAAKPADGSAPAAASAPAAGAAEPAKKLSPLEMMKAKAAAKLAEGAAPAAAAEAAPVADAPAAEPAIKLSPLEQMKAKAAAKAAAAAGVSASETPVAAAPTEAPASSPAEAPVKKLSPLEMVRAQAAKKAALASGAETPAPAPLKQIAPAPTAATSTAPAPAAASGKSKLPPIAASVENVEAELQSVGKLFTEQYGYSESASKEVVELTRPFLKTPTEPSLAETQHANRTASSELQPTSAPTVAIVSSVPAAADPTPPVAAALVAEPGKKLSPLEFMKQQAAAKKAAAAGATEAPAPTVAAIETAAPAAFDPDKTLSPLELMKAKAAAKKAAEAGAALVGDAPLAPAPDAPAKLLSPLEQMKAKAAAKASGDSAAPGGAAPKPLSPLEQMKANKAAAAAAGGEAPAAAPKPAVAAKPVAPKVAPPAPVAIRKAAKTPVLRTEELHRFYVKTARPFLNSNGRQGALSNAIDASREFNQLRASLPVELHEALAALQERCDEHRQFASLERIHHWLHYWLALHIPFSIALFVFFIVHVLVALRVVPWALPFRLYQ